MTERTTVSKVRRVGWVGLICNLLLAGIKVVAGVVGNSQAVLADAFHSLTDVLTDIAVILGVRYWSAPADENHPHGHGRIETLVAVVIGLSVGGVAIGMGFNAIRDLGVVRSHGPAGVALGAALLSIVVKEILYRWTERVGRECDSPALAANAWHHRSDAMSSIPVAVAVAVALIDPGLAVVDSIGAFVVSVFILRAAWQILRPAVDQLIDASAPPSVRHRIEALAVEVDGVEAAHAVRTRYVGSKIAADLHVEVDGGMSVGEGHQIAVEVREKLVEEIKEVTDVLVQVEPHVLDGPE